MTCRTLDTILYSALTLLGVVGVYSCLSLEPPNWSASFLFTASTVLFAFLGYKNLVHEVNEGGKTECWDIYRHYHPNTLGPLGLLSKLWIKRTKKHPKTDPIVAKKGIIVDAREYVLAACMTYQSIDQKIGSLKDKVSTNIRKTQEALEGLEDVSLREEVKIRLQGSLTFQLDLLLKAQSDLVTFSEEVKTQSAAYSKELDGITKVQRAIEALNLIEDNKILLEEISYRMQTAKSTISQLEARVESIAIGAASEAAALIEVKSLSS